MSHAVLYECTIRHERRSPLRHGFRYSGYVWYVDVDNLPHIPWCLRFLARFDPADHGMAPSQTTREGINRYLAAHGVDLSEGKVFMLGNPRVLGYVFNPLTVFWCWHRDGSLACVVTEVHNTYGGRHRYLLFPDATGRARAEKTFYVSPFFAVEGTYHMRLPEPGERLAISVVLRQRGKTVFTATLRGRCRPLTVRTLLAMAMRHPWVTASAAVHIRIQGLLLYLQGLPIHPRTSATGVPDEPA